MKNKLQEILELARSNEILAQWLHDLNENRYSYYTDIGDSLNDSCFYCEQERGSGAGVEWWKIEHKPNCKAKLLVDLLEQLTGEKDKYSRDIWE